MPVERELEQKSKGEKEKKKEEIFKQSKPQKIETIRGWQDSSYQALLAFVAHFQEKAKMVTRQHRECSQLHLLLHLELLLESEVRNRCGPHHLNALNFKIVKLTVDAIQPLLQSASLQHRIGLTIIRQSWLHIHQTEKQLTCFKACSH